MNGRFTNITLSEVNGVFTIKLNNPPVNAISRRLFGELKKSVSLVKNAKRGKMLVIQGTGKNFCAGADLKDRATFSEKETKQFVKNLSNLFQEIAALPIPTLAVINGNCIGGGLELALSCDLRLMANQGVIGLKETSLGIIPGAGGTQRLPRLIGSSKALYWIYSARSFSPKEAFQYGVIDFLVKPLEMEKKVREIVNVFTLNAPLAQIAAKRAVYEGEGQKLSDGLIIEQKQYQSILRTKDRVEALQAFKEKRRPQWRGK